MDWNQVELQFLHILSYSPPQGWGNPVHKAVTLQHVMLASPVAVLTLEYQPITRPCLDHVITWGDDKTQTITYLWCDHYTVECPDTSPPVFLFVHVPP